MTGLLLSALIEAARAHREAGRLGEAVGLLAAVLQTAPGNGLAHHEVGLALIAGDDAAGIKNLEAAVRLDPGNADRRADLGEAKARFGDPAGGLSALRAAVALEPDGAMRVLRLGKTLAALDLHDEGDLWMRRALALRRPFGEAHVARGFHIYRQGRVGESVQIFHQAVIEDPDHANGYFMLAGALQKAGAPKEMVMRPARIAAERMPDRKDAVLPVVQYLRDIGEEADSVRLATRIIGKEMTAAAADEFGAHGFRILEPDDLITRIGEFAHQLDIHVKMKLLGWLPPFVTILLAPPDRVVNRSFLDHWRRYITVVDDPKLIERIEPLRHRIPFNPVYIRMPDGRAMSKNRLTYAVQEEWQRQGRGPLLDLDRRHSERGWEALSRLGVPAGAWFVCVHVRESGYMKETATSSEAGRNADIRAFLPAMEAITRRGGWVVRLGDPSMTPLPAMPQVVDYALSAQRSDWMDVFLAASCRFILATTSGMMLVSLNFGVPIAASNYFPPGEKPLTSHDLFTPKLLREQASGRLLTFEECLAMPLALTYDARRLADLGLEVIDNDQPDILGLAEEMLEKVEGRVIYTAEDEALQRRWDELRRPWSTGESGSRVARSFLRRHRQLFRPR